MPAADQPVKEEDTEHSLFIRLSSRPAECFATDVSRRVGELCRATLCDSDVSSRFHMAALELAENVSKYSTSSRASLKLQLERRQDEGYSVSIRTRNQAPPARLAEVARRLDELMGTRDAVALYDRLIEESPPIEGVSGLGLARIKAEGGLDLDYAISGSELTIIARGRFPNPPPPEAA